jgi:hypothetical protein
MYNVLQFWNVIGSIAIFTLAVSVFEPLRLLVGDESFWVDALININVVILSRVEAHHIKLHVSLCLTSGADQSSRLVRGFPVTDNIKRTM